MKELAVITYQSFHRGEGGGTLYAATIARRARDEGYNVTIIARSPDARDHETVVDGMRIVELSGFRISVTRFWRVLDKDVGYAWVLRKYLRKHGARYDIIQSIVPDVTAAIPKNMHAKSVVSVIEDFWSPKTSFAHTAFARYQRFQAGLAVRSCYKVTLPSETSLDVFQQWFPGSKQRFQVVQDFVDAELFAENGENQQKIVQRFAGVTPLVFVPQRSVALKKVDTIVRAIPEIKKTHPTVHVAIAGGGPLEAQHKQLATERGVSENITWLGMVSYREEMPTLYRIADAVVITSSSEGAQPSPTASEAMATGTPVVMTTACDTANVFAGIVSTFAPGDAHELARHITGVLKDPENAKTAAQKAKAIILERFSQVAFLARFLKLYQGITR